VIINISCESSFFLKSVDFDLSFKRDENDQIIGMEINYNGSKQFLKKIK